MSAKFDPTLYLVTDRRIPPNTTVESIVRAAVTGKGHARVTTVQLRDKQVPERETLRLGHTLRALCTATKTSFIVNDSVALAVTLGADGVHLGQDDAPIGTARAALGARGIIGVSVGTVDEARAAVADGADYIGVGAVFRTGTKSDAGAPIGVSRLREIADAVNGAVPVVAIGGISAGNVAACADAHADGVAVVSAIMGSGNPAEAAASLYNTFTTGG